MMAGQNFTIPYEAFFQSGLRQVVHSTLKQVQRLGLPPEHRLYITFFTAHPGIQMADWLLEAYPETMTIVLGSSFWDLEVDDGGFSVTLSFSGKPASLSIPFLSMLRFSDPYAKFSLELQPSFSQDVMEKKQATPLVAQEDDRLNGCVIDLDSFRKK